MSKVLRQADGTTVAVLDPIILLSPEIDFEALGDTVVLGELDEVRKVVIKSITPVVTETSGTSTGVTLRLKQGSGLIGSADAITSNMADNAFEALTHAVGTVIDLKDGLKVTVTIVGVDAGGAYKGRVLIELIPFFG